MKIIIGILITAAALWLTTAVVPGIRIESSLTSFLIVAVVFGLVNVFVRPVVRLLSLPVTILTLGLFLLVINAIQNKFFPESRCSAGIDRSMATG